MGKMSSVKSIDTIFISFYDSGMSDEMLLLVDEEKSCRTGSPLEMPL